MICVPEERTVQGTMVSPPSLRRCILYLLNPCQTRSEYSIHRWRGAGCELFLDPLSSLDDGYSIPLRSRRIAARMRGVAGRSARVHCRRACGRAVGAEQRFWQSSVGGVQRRLGARGWIGMTWPKCYGGHGRSMLERYIVTEELLAAGAPVG